MTKFSKPTGKLGKILAKGFAFGHKDFYKNTASVAELTESDELLEIGFGAGMFINKYAKHIKHIAGLDISPDMVELAKEINSKLFYEKKLELIEGNILSLPWSDNTFSVIISIESFFFWENVEKALLEIYRVLKPGGRIVIEMAFNLEDGQDHTKNIKKIGFQLYDEKNIRNLLEESGFIDLSFNYYKAFWIPIKGYIVTKGMIFKACKPN